MKFWILTFATLAAFVIIIANSIPERKPYTDKEIIQIYETGFVRGYLAARQTAINKSAVTDIPNTDSVWLIIDHTKGDSLRVADSIDIIKKIFKR